MYRLIPVFTVLTMLCSCKNDAPPPAAPGFHADTVHVAAAPSGIPATGDAPAQFVPAGYFIQYEAEGDLTGDGINDFAIVLRELADSTSPRALAVLIRQPSGPAYRLADTGWEAIGPQYTGEGYPIRGTETLEIKQGEIQLKLYEPGPAGNQFTTYRYDRGNIILTQAENFFQGAGAATGTHLNLLTGILTTDEINRMRDPEETTTTTDTLAPERVLLRNANPDKLINN